MSGGKGKVFSVVVAALVGLLVALTPIAGAAEPCPSSGEGMWFPDIHGPEDPEDYCWEVGMSHDQELVQIDDRHAAVYYESGHLAFSIEAEAAHDAEGTTVPTTLAVTAPNLITLTVHHRAGNPAAGGAPFHYPIIEGTGWEGGFHTTIIQMPGDPPAPQPLQTEEPMCTVPALRGRSLRAARRALLRVHCELGPVRGERSRAAKVIKQYREAGKALPAGTEVGVKLA
jgi:hypothetical protein